MYCPMKLYIQNHIDLEENTDFQLSIEIKKLKIDIQDLIQKNMRKIKKEMRLENVSKYFIFNRRFNFRWCYWLFCFICEILIHFSPKKIANYQLCFK